MSRYILNRICEEHHIEVVLEPKPLPGWQGLGGHTNFSTAAMREERGSAAIMTAIGRLERNHARHIKVYDPSGGIDNALRLKSGVVTASIDTFVFGLANRATSVRVPQHVVMDGRGYIEDRRPAGNMDPYAVCEMIVRTVCLEE